MKYIGTVYILWQVNKLNKAEAQPDLRLRGADLLESSLKKNGIELNVRKEE